MWKETLSLDTSLGEEEYRVFLDSRHDKSRWDIGRFGWTADYNDASNFLDTLRQHSPNNDPAYASVSFDASLDAASRMPDPQRRREILEAAERTMLGDYPVVPLYFFVSKRLVKPYVRGLLPNPLNHIRSKALTSQR